MSNKKKNEIWGEPHICYYCGQRAGSIDHVIPQATLRMLATLSDLPITKELLRNRALKVWACRECNSLLTDSLQESLKARKAYLKIRLIKKYKKILGLPSWSESEVEELGYTLRTHIETMARIKEHIRKRIIW
jgi:uncharacterized protein YlaI